MTYAEGDLVWVEDPSMGWQPATVTAVGESGDLYVEGPYLPQDSRIVAWRVDDWAVPKMVSPRRETVNGKEDRLRGLMDALEAAFVAGEYDAARTLAARAETLAADVDAHRRRMRVSA